MRLCRRSLLRGALGGVSVALGLPALDRFFNQSGTAFADGTSPLRFGQWFWGGGTGHNVSRFYPQNPGPLSQLPDQLSPLSPYLTEMNVVSGMGHGDKSEVPGFIGHGANQCLVLSGYFRRGIADIYKNHPDHGPAGTDLPSIDQRVATAWGASLGEEHLALQISKSGPHSGKTSFRGRGKYNAMPNTPHVAFGRLFSSPEPGNNTGGNNNAQLLNELRGGRSILDALQEDIRSLENELSGHDRARFQEHLSAVETLEQDVVRRENEILEDNPVSPPGGCRAHVPIRAYGDEALVAHNKIMADLLVLAIQCGRAKVFAFEFSACQAYTRYKEIGVNLNHHDEVTHNNANRAKLPATTKFTMECLGYLVGKLHASQEGAQTLLDNTCLLATTEMLWSPGHNANDTPALLFGKAGGRLKTGLHHRDVGGNFNRIAMTAYKALGLDIASQGKGLWETSEPINSLLA